MSTLKKEQESNPNHHLYMTPNQLSMIEGYSKKSIAILVVVVEVYTEQRKGTRIVNGVSSEDRGLHDHSQWLPTI